MFTICAALVAFSAVGCKQNMREFQINDPTITQSYVGYYESLSMGIKGDELKTELRELNKTKKVYTINFNEGRSTNMGKNINTYALTDADPRDPTKIIGFYDNVSYQAAWNQGNIWQREHVWPDSRGGNLVENDVLMSRPCARSINASRNNKAYDNYTTNTTFDPGQYCANYRGIAARIIFYCALIEPRLKLTDNVSDTYLNMAKLSVLLEWNREYPPSTDIYADVELRVEQNRNDVAESLQGNRNPFVDHPEFVDMIWAN